MYLSHIYDNCLFAGNNFKYEKKLLIMLITLFIFFNKLIRTFKCLSN